MNAKRSTNTHKPAEEPAGRFQRLRTRRLSIHSHDSKDTAKATPNPANHTPLEIAVTQHANLGPGRRRASASGLSNNGMHDPGSGVAKLHRKPLPDKPHMNRSVHDTSTTRLPKASLPEKSDLRSPRTPSTANTMNTTIMNQEPVQKYQAPAVTSDASAMVYKPGSILKQNAEYFDMDQDGVIWPRDTYKGCRKLGWGTPSSALAVLVLHTTLSYPTGQGYAPDPSLRIRYENPHHGERGNADEKGHLGPNLACEHILTKYECNSQSGMDRRDVVKFWNDQKSTSGFRDWSITVFEWLALYALLRPKDGVLHNTDIRSAFDGSILYKKAEERQRKVDTHPKHAGSEKYISDGQSSQVKLAVAIIVGLVFLIWGMRSLMNGAPGWLTRWWYKTDMMEGATWTNPVKFEN
ncbi:hypothetical protein M426DRAFT_8819 [Hypoxylon sp. CI-4A]|nr:hypothetical protein M426DRAFT_8819 [Hypoxylon sp. CI-4A]